ncbi:MAG TPA: hypothetical protein VGM01_06175 [Ktedonobacteraceae bacterium]|jgi:hypothetical protein
MQQNTPDRERPETNIPNLGQAAPADSPYTNDEWRCLVETPVKIGRAMMAISPSGAIGMTQEIMALRKSMTEGLQAAKQPILVNMRQNLQSQGALETIWEDAGHAFSDRWDAANVRQTAIASCQEAVTLAQKMSPQDAQAYKDFVYTTALKVAQAAKEGGFMGIGGVAVSAEEKSLLNDVSRTLGVPH